MLKKFIVLALLSQLLFACPQEIQDVLDGVLADTKELTNAQIGQGLKEALNVGISKGSARLSQKNGYFKSNYKILLPAEVRKVTDRLQSIPGFSNVENILLEKINRGAEDAAKKAKPIFISAIKQMSFRDVMNILMGKDDSATRYLEGSTRTKLYREFNPVIANSLDKFEARKYWSNLATKYNQIPLLDDVNADLGNYVTQEALKGLFSMVEKEEKNIRHNLVARTTDLLKRVFAKQDNR